MARYLCGHYTRELIEYDNEHGVRVRICQPCKDKKDGVGTPEPEGPPTAEGVRDSAMAQVEDRAGEEWNEAALRAVRRTAEQMYELIVDDVWERMPTSVAPTHDLRAMGPVMIRALNAGWIAKTETYRHSKKLTSHGVPRRLWRSRLVEGPLHGGNGGSGA